MSKAGLVVQGASDELDWWKLGLVKKIWKFGYNLNWSEFKNIAISINKKIEPTRISRPMLVSKGRNVV